MFKKNIFGIIMVGMIWYCLSFAIGARFVPYPHQVILNVIFNFSEILPHLTATMFRLIFGFSFGLLVSIIIGVAMGLNSKIDSLLSPLVYCLGPIPKAALTPVFLIIFGLNDVARIMIVIFIIIFPMIVSIRDGIKLLPEEYFIIAKTLDLSKKDFYFKIIGMGILPNLLTTVKVTIAIAIAVLYISENIGAKYGLGYFIASNNGIDNIAMYSGIFVLSMIGYIVVLCVDGVLKNCKWL